jgi:NADH dehydrogenase/NADH:ubiquinone oxidoreductase subunit G
MINDLETEDLNENTQNDASEMPETKRLTALQAARAMKCSIPTVYNRAKKHNWERGIDDNGLAWMEIPVKWLKHKYDSDEEAENSSAEIMEQAINSVREAYEEQKKLMEIILESKESELAAQKALFESKDNEIKAKNSQIEALNNQISAQNNQLVLLRDKNTQNNQPPSPPKPKTFLEKLAFLFPGKSDS